MNVDQLREYCLNKTLVTESFPFDMDTLVFKVAGKMFALFPLEKWENGLASVNLKCDPDYAIELRAEYESIQPGFHMNKKHWNSIYIHKAELQSEFVLKLIDHSYDLVVKGLPKKIRDSLK